MLVIEQKKLNKLHTFISQTYKRPVVSWLFR